MAIQGDDAFCGAFGDSNGQGAVYVYHHTGQQWVETAKLTASDKAEWDYFGHSLAVDGDYLVIGAGGADLPGKADAGAAYVFHWEGGSWVQQAKLTASTGAGSDDFGAAVDISGDWIVVGADYATANGQPHSGSAYVFQRTGTTWTPQGQMVGASVAVNDNYGYSVAISGDHAIVGAYRHDAPGHSEGGAAYIFARNGAAWAQTAELDPTVKPDYGGFGYDVAITDGYAMVSATADVAYIYALQGTSWVDQAHVIPDDFPDSNGASVAISPEYAVLGHRYEGHAGASCGAVYVFAPHNGAWEQQYKLVASDAASNDSLGAGSVGLDGTEVIAGALFKTVNGVGDAGEAYVFDSARYLDAKGKLTFHDDNNNLVTIALSGGGTGKVSFDHQEPCDANTLVLYGTTDKSSLTISVKGTYTTLKEIELAGDGSLKSLMPRRRTWRAGACGPRARAASPPSPWAT